jgi:hypothetical protein
MTKKEISEVLKSNFPSASIRSIERASTELLMSSGAKKYVEHEFDNGELITLYRNVTGPLCDKIKQLLEKRMK